MHIEIPAGAEPVDVFRRAFHAERLRLVRAHGVELFDLAQVLYAGAEGGPWRVVQDALPVLPASEGVAAFLEGLSEGWWGGRATPPPGAGAPVAGLYARYLPEVGFDYSLEFGPEGLRSAWRMDGRGRVTPLVLPTDDGMFRDQTGTFIDARAGWRWLVGEQQRTGRIAVAEVQGGYQIGVRAGVPGDPNPADRPDAELDEVFSRWDPHAYDTLELLNGPLADALPLPEQRFDEWLGAATPLAVAGQVDLFVLAESSEFLACIEDLAKEYGIAVEWIEPEVDLRVAFHAGPLRLERDFAAPYLRTLHGGRSFVLGVRLEYGPALEALDAARTLLGQAEAALPGFTVDVVEGSVLRVRDAAGAVLRQVDLLALAGRQTLPGAQGQAALLKLLGWDAAAQAFVPPPPFDPTVCPITGAPARVGKVIRPARLLGMDHKALVGAPVGDHVVFYTLDSATHSTPVLAGPGRSAAELEEVWQADQAGAELVVVATRELGAALVVAGFDAGSLCLAPGRVRGLVEALGWPGEGQIVGSLEVRAPHPDVLVIAPEALAGEALDQARRVARQLQEGHFPGRAFPMTVVRRFDGAEHAPVGRVAWAQ